ncbi:MAG: hypothetical protein OEW39_14100 [Deltaproteobacteria bacterium]|nr:hypothetical protein [Deltaproteobacteria bacterium]
MRESPPQLTPQGKRLLARWVYVMVRVGEEFVVPYTGAALTQISESAAYPPDFPGVLGRVMAALEDPRWPAASYYPGGWYRALRERGEDPATAPVTPETLAGFTLEEVRVDAQGRWQMGARSLGGRVLDHFLRHLEYDPVLERYRVRYRLEDRFDARYLHHQSPPLRVRRLLREDQAVWVCLNDGTREPLRLETLFLDARERLFCAVKPSSLPAVFEDVPRWEVLQEAEETPQGWRLPRLGFLLPRSEGRHWPHADHLPD